MIRNRIPDKWKAKSILEAAQKEIVFIKTIPITEESAATVIRSIYECFRMLGDAHLISRGFASEDHIEQIKELENIPAKTDRPIKLIDSLRRLRHNINYYGYAPSKIEAEDAISIAKACFYPILDVIKKELHR